MHKQESNQQTPELLWQVFDDLEKKGMLKVMVRAGTITPEIVRYYKITAAYYEKRSRRRIASDADLKNDLCPVFNVGRSTIYKAIKIMETSVCNRI
jgi:DNA-binding GntR family transcriptional regulator